MAIDPAILNRVKEDTALAVALAALDAKGDADTIARFLESQGIKGNRQMACQCPVAVYLKKQIGGKLVSVTSRYTHSVSFTADAPLAAVKTPDNVSEFVYSFDTGSYPELEH